MLLDTNNLWYGSICVELRDGIKTDIRHTGVLIRAVSQSEARGKAIEIAERLYPPSRGFGRHHAAISSVQSTSVIYDPAQAGFIA